jgi:hypothetical protein
MIEHIIVEIRANGKCTDAECDCPYLTAEWKIWCQLFGGDVSNGPVEACLKHRAQVTEFLEHAHKELKRLSMNPYAVQIAQRLKDQLQKLLGKKTS